MECSLKAQENINKKNIVVAPVWIGSRYLDDKDFDAFSRQMYLREFEYPGIVYGFDIDYRINNKMSCLPELTSLLEAIRGLKVDFGSSLVIMLIVTSTFAESRYYRPFISVVEKIAGKSKVFHIIMGPGLGGHYSREEALPYKPNERRAHDLGAVYLYYNDDAPTAGALRLVTFMNRILGFDLPGEDLPDYNFEELKKMAWHISRESFNAFESRKDAIPKYKIKDGRPAFQI